MNSALSVLFDLIYAVCDLHNINVQGQLKFDSDLVLDTLRLVLHNLPKKSDGELRDLTVLCLLALFKTARELASTRPLEHFPIDLCQASGS